ncbi:hypothetical protein H0H93_004823 [Arthromyces matolae]|nr:hypothetical protein H0H93_004823 [Arthromyces matolae]
MGEWYEWEWVWCMVFEVGPNEDGHHDNDDDKEERREEEKEKDPWMTRVKALPLLDDNHLCLSPRTRPPQPWVRETLACLQDRINIRVFVV